MRFSSVFPTNAARRDAPGREHAGAEQPLDAPRPVPVVQPPWPPGEPPDDLDQRVRQVGEWQIGDW